MGSRVEAMGREQAEWNADEQHAAQPAGDSGRPRGSPGQAQLPPGRPEGPAGLAERPWDSLKRFTRRHNHDRKRHDSER